MIIVDILLAFLVAMLVTGIFVGFLGHRGLWDTWWSYFLIIFLVAWAAGLWIGPYAPWGLFWLPYLFFALLIALILAAMTPGGTAPPRGRPVTAPEERAEAEAAAGVSIAFWVLVALLFVAAIAAYF